MRFGKGALWRALLPVVAAAGITASAAGTHAAVSSTLYAGFDADGNIRLTYADGTMIGTPTPPGTIVPTGTYTIDLNNNGLDDAGGTHIFHLLGPGREPLGREQPVRDAHLDRDLPAELDVRLPGRQQPDHHPRGLRDAGLRGGHGRDLTSADGDGATSAGLRQDSAARLEGHRRLGLSCRSEARSSAPSARPGSSRSPEGQAGDEPEERALHDPASPTARQEAASPSRRSHDGRDHRHRRARSPASARGRSPSAPGQWFFYPTFVGKKTYFIVTA